jgi:hypothetical protein
MITKRMSLTGGVLLTLIALSTVGATAAQAEEAPYWSIEGTRLAAGKTAEVTAKAVTNKTFIAGTVTVTCSKGELEKGAVLVGSEPGEPGKSEGVVKLSGCTVTGNGEPCEVPNGEIVTHPLVGELVYASNKKSLVGVASPTTGKKIATLKFSGRGCKETEVAAEGSIVGGILTDPGEVLLELPNTVAQAKSFLGKTIVASRTKIWLIKGGAGSEVETAELKAFGHEATLAGTDLASLVSGKAWAPEF